MTAVTQLLAAAAAAVCPQAAELVKLRYFAGLTGREAAGLLGVSPARPTSSGPTPGPGSSTGSPRIPRRLKIIKPGIDSKQVVARFEQVVARFEAERHPRVRIRERGGWED